MRTYWSMAGAVVLAIVSVAVGNGLTAASAAAAEAPGEIGQVGSFGEGEGQFQWPTQIAVDPTDNSVYVLDDPTSPTTRPKVETSVRIQKFSAGLGKPVATLTVATPEVTVGGESEFQVVAGLAVDPKLHRLYVLKGVRTEGLEPGDITVGSEIDAFSTKEEQVNGKSTLPVAEGVHEVVETAPGVKEARYYKFPPPPTVVPVPAKTLGTPRGLALDPSGSGHDLIVLGGEESRHTVVQRISGATGSFEAGALTGEFDDTGELLNQAGGEATGVAVAPSGTLYLTSPAVAPAVSGIASLSSNLQNVSVFREAEEPFGFTAGTSFDFFQEPQGSSIAVAPDSGTVYAFETGQPENAATPPDTPGTYELAGFSSADKSQQVIYGGASTSALRCVIASKYDAVAAGSGGVVYALDGGNRDTISGVEGPSPFGFRLIEFGPGGSDSECPEPVAAFTIDSNVSNSTVRVEKGSSVAFAASSAELRGAEPEALTWKTEGPATWEETITQGCPTTPATCLVASHTFLKPGLYTADLQMTVKNSPFGQPPAATRKLEVFAPPPTAAFTASNQEPQSGEDVTFNGAESLDPTGSPNGTPTNTMESYTWSFGDGEVKTTSTPQFTRSFANSGAAARAETVTLTVTNREKVQSAPSTQQLTVKGTGSSGGGGGTGGSTGGGGGSTPTTTPATTPTTTPSALVHPPVVKPVPLTRAQKLAKALRQCRKLKHRKLRLSCERAARKKYAPPKKRH